MLLPANFTRIVADTFYDKTVTVLNKTTNSVDGWVTETGTTVKSTFKGNVRFTALGEVQSELGLTPDIDIAVTCPVGTAVTTDDLIAYNDVTYAVSDVVPSDSHLTITGTKWA